MDTFELHYEKSDYFDIFFNLLDPAHDPTPCGAYGFSITSVTPTILLDKITLEADGSITVD